MDMLSPVSAAVGFDVPEHHWNVARSPHNVTAYIGLTSLKQRRLIMTHHAAGI